MNRPARWTVALVVTLALAGAPPARAADDERLCLVCKVTEGATEPEPVKAWRTHDGTRYGFCAERCAAAFDADPAAYLPPRFPRPAPPLSVHAPEGGPFDLDALAGRVVLVDFWATWCPPCRKSMPELQALHERYAPRGFTVLGVSVDEARDARKVRKFAAGRKITYPIAIDSEESPTWERFGVKAVPAAFLLDRAGRIVAQWTGAPANLAEVEQAIVPLLAPAD